MCVALWTLLSSRQPDELSGTITPTVSPTPMNLQNKIDPNNTPTPAIKQYGSLPETILNEEQTYHVILTTDQGDIEIKLFNNEVPIATNNFAFLAQDGFYDDTIFHRVMNGFMIQGGDPLGTGTGSPGYRFADEDITRSYNRGIVAYANSGPNTNGSQFFIMHADYPLGPQYVIFGEVINGMDVVDAIATAPVTADARGEQSKPVTPVHIISAELVEQ